MNTFYIQVNRNPNALASLKAIFNQYGVIYTDRQLTPPKYIYVSYTGNGSYYARNQNLVSGVFVYDALQDLGSIVDIFANKIAKNIKFDLTYRKSDGTVDDYQILDIQESDSERIIANVFNRGIRHFKWSGIRSLTAVK